MADLRTYNPPLRDRIAWGIAGGLGDMFGAGRYARQDIADKASGLMDFVPGLGEFLGADDVASSLEDRDWRNAAINAGALGLGVVPVVGDLAGKGLKKLESRTARMYNPPVKEARPFEADYPSGAVADGTGKLAFDIDGNSLTARHVVGRTQVGGSDVALPSEALDEIAKAGTGSGILAAPAGLKSGDAGALYVNRYTGVPDKIEVDARLNPDQFERVARHEVSHLVDSLAGEVSADGLNDELRAVYNHLNNPQSYGKRFGPEQHRYRGENVQRELMAESIRAYMTDPNYIKTVAPKTARRIREYVNVHPKLKDIIQFNSIAPAAVGGAGLMSMGVADDR